MTALKKATVTLNKEDIAEAMKDKRRAIYADIIATLKRPPKKRYRAATRTYFQLNNAGGLNASASFQEQLPQVEANCTVCGMGACFISHVRLANQFTLAQIVDRHNITDGHINPWITPRAYDEDIFKVMKSYFPIRQLRMVEAAFEGTFQGHNLKPTKKQIETARAWIKDIPNDTSRLRAIAENGLRNKGNFNLMQLPAKPRCKRTTAANKSSKKASRARA